MKLSLVLSALVALTIGCSSVKQIGAIPTPQGEYKFFKVHLEELTGPNITVMAVQAPDGKVTLPATYGGPGFATVVAPAAVTAGGEVIAAREFGHSLKPDRTIVKNSAAGGDSTGATADAAGGNATGGSSSVDQSKNDNHIDNSVRVDKSVRTTTNNDNRAVNVNVGQ